MAMAGSVGVKSRPHHSTPRRFLGRMSDIGTIEDASVVLSVPSSPTTVVASPLPSPTAVDTSSPIFPIEVFEHIIDECCIGEGEGWYDRESIRDDQETLLACALTCKAWLPRSRFHILRRVAFSDTSQVFKFAHLLDAHPDMANLVQCLNVYEERAYPGRAGHTWHVFAFLMMLTRRMPVLRSLVFEGTDIHNISFDHRSIICISAFPAITSLSLSNAKFASVAHLGRLILSIPALRSLACSEVRFRKQGFDVCDLPPQANRLRLTSITLQDCPNEDVVNLLLATSTGEHFESLDVDLFAAYYGGSRLLRHSGQGLRTLRMYADAESIKDMTQQLSPCDLSHNINLKELIIDDTASVPASVWIPNLLRTVATSAMQEVTVNFVKARWMASYSPEWKILPPYILLSEDDCAAIDGALSRSKFARLRKFRLTLDWHVDVEPYMACFPRLLRRGILSIDAGRDSSMFGQPMRYPYYSVRKNDRRGHLK